MTDRTYTVTFTPWPITVYHAERMRTSQKPWERIIPGEFYISCSNGEQSWLYLDWNNNQIDPTQYSDYWVDFTTDPTTARITSSFTIMFDMRREGMRLQAVSNLMWEPYAHDEEGVIAEAAIGPDLEFTWTVRDRLPERARLIEAIFGGVYSSFHVTPVVLAEGHHFYKERTLSTGEQELEEIHLCANSSSITRLFITASWDVEGPEGKHVTGGYEATIMDHSGHVGVLTWSTPEDARYTSVPKLVLYEAPLSGDALPQKVQAILPYLPAAPGASLTEHGTGEQ